MKSSPQTIKAAQAWRSIADELPEEGVVVETKIDDAAGVRNEARLKRRGRMFFFADESMYVYYTPTHWRPCPAAAVAAVGEVLKSVIFCENCMARLPHPVDVRRGHEGKEHVALCFKCGSAVIRN